MVEFWVMVWVLIIVQMIVGIALMEYMYDTNDSKTVTEVTHNG